MLVVVDFGSTNLLRWQARCNAGIRRILSSKMFVYSAVYIYIFTPHAPKRSQTAKMWPEDRGGSLRPLSTSCGTHGCAPLAVANEIYAASALLAIIE